MTTEDNVVNDIDKVDEAGGSERVTEETGEEISKETSVEKEAAETFHNFAKTGELPPKELQEETPIVDEKGENGSEEIVEITSPAVDAAAAATATATAVKSEKKKVKFDTNPTVTTPVDVKLELTRVIQKAETIVESFSGVKIFPITGGLENTIHKERFKSFFHAAFVSSRASGVLTKPYFTESLQSGPTGRGAVVSIETSKFIVCIPRKSKEEYNKKIRDYAMANRWTEIQPKIPRRRRDEEDKVDDVIFFRCGS
jgi:hypothetical protein